MEASTTFPDNFDATVISLCYNQRRDTFGEPSSGAVD
jgi:hypothetical protein